MAGVNEMKPALRTSIERGTCVAKNYQCTVYSHMFYAVELKVCNWIFIPM